MSIYEYGDNNPHPSGFIGLRVEVKKIQAATFQQYFNFRGLDSAAREKLRAKAERIDKRETKDQALRYRSMLISRPSKSPLSGVYGIAVGLRSRSEINGGYRHEIYISASGAGVRGLALDKSGAICRFSKTYSHYDYEWFVSAWKKVCRERARAIGLKRTPSQWLMGIASEKEVLQFFNLKIRQNEKRLKAK